MITTDDFEGRPEEFCYVELTIKVLVPRANWSGKHVLQLVSEAYDIRRETMRGGIEVGVCERAGHVVPADEIYPESVSADPYTEEPVPAHCRDCVEEEVRAAEARAEGRYER